MAMNSINGCQLAEFLNHVASHSKYYQGLWKDVKPSSHPKLEDYPLVDHTSFWDANRVANNTVLTAKQQNGIVMKTGGKSSFALPRPVDMS
jgi:phenylacetate-CoA ligase